MIAEYKLYHGAVFVELAGATSGAISIQEINEDGRLSSYVLDDKVGLLIKHCANRLHPWHFTFTKSNIIQLLQLRKNYKSVFVALVCHTDGILTLTLEEAINILRTKVSEQAWIRVDRRRNQPYSVAGGGGELLGKRSQGVRRILQSL